MICGRGEVEMTACNSYLRCRMGTKERLQRLRMVRTMPMAPAAVSAWPSCDLAAVSRSFMPVQISLLIDSEDHSLAVGKYSLSVMWMLIFLWMCGHARVYPPMRHCQTCKADCRTATVHDQAWFFTGTLPMHHLVLMLASKYCTSTAPAASLGVETANF